MQQLLLLMHSFPLAPRRSHPLAPPPHTAHQHPPTHSQKRFLAPKNWVPSMWYVKEYPKGPEQESS